ncbi:UDP-2,3-diacylglucosamine diphosphatase [Herbaspirillum seropedicae]|uniref:UDP-2,3-diacylglucosamine hydrolase n=1 Tax=Herbaspirillum seropedicae (strain SmR1) TaxID=757424 RepID=D8IRQ0_HERSS|nr:UDP-2,3-diacylglucosamine diphosphatase [Herbaspirillum seropedicae]ADJ63374.1 UDP-2,3-diacylglucosamine hydrolase protein [Herbaspirillum seropedicae SmR1]AKN65408.1 UDP-2,3-diacylglucosamine hydrolase [Herbaspirillum seropedicae]NQE28569.1 UDP-2,3-diacylglucosamine hydrolase [Herbaspirillum seropedicae]UMU21379.1 UDP-2,3-diacylglucosamine diphosphatase [Herbaspirillum seropedicae]
MTDFQFMQKAQPTVALFVSDLHLQASLPRTTAAFLAFLQSHAAQTQQLYLLGDIFEYWAGDDDLATPYNQFIADALKALQAQGVQLYWMAGNRDFLVGQAFADAAGLTLLQDPHVITAAGRRLTLAHGDAQCTDDHAYMAFRAQVRQPAYQQQFLAMPLAQRKAIIEGIRKNSQDANQSKEMAIMDVNAGAIDTLFAQTGTDTLIHGHTHRPALHRLGEGPAGKLRYVLPDWEYDVETPRGGWISLTADGALHRHDVNGDEIA